MQLLILLFEVKLWERKPRILIELMVKTQFLRARFHYFCGISFGGSSSKISPNFCFAALCSFACVVIFSIAQKIVIQSAVNSD